MTTQDRRETTPDNAAAIRDTLTRAQRFGEGGFKRMAVLGASTWGVALGLSPFAAPIDLWREIVEGTSSFTGNAATQLGEDLEDGVARNAARQLGVACLDSPPTLRHPTRRWSVATPDRVVTELGPNARPGVDLGDLMQVKTTALMRPVRRAHLDGQWGEPGTGDVPEHVLAQCMGELFIARAWAERHRDVWKLPLPARNHVAALIGGRGLQVFVVEWDPEFAEALAARVADFWALVVDGEPPPIDESKAWGKELQRIHPKHNPDAWKVADSESAELVRIVLETKEVVALAERRGALAENLLKARIGDAEGLRGPWGRVPWRDRAGRSAVAFTPMAERLLELAHLHHAARVDALADAREVARGLLDVIARQCGTGPTYAAALESALPLLADEPDTFGVPDDVDDVVASFRVPGKRTRAFGPLTVDAPVLAACFPPSEVITSRVEGAIVMAELEAEALEAEPDPAMLKAIANTLEIQATAQQLEITDRIERAMREGKALDVADLLALPAATPTTELLAQLNERMLPPIPINRATPTTTAAWVQPPGSVDPSAPMERPANCRCLRAVLGRSKAGRVECYTCGAGGGGREPRIHDEVVAVIRLAADAPDVDDLAPLTAEADASIIDTARFLAHAVTDPKRFDPPDPYAANPGARPHPHPGTLTVGEIKAKVADLRAAAGLEEWTGDGAGGVVRAEPMPLAPGAVIVTVGVPEAYPDDDSDPWVISRKNTRPTVHRVFLTTTGEWSKSRELARRFDDELSATRAKPRQTRVCRMSELDKPPAMRTAADEGGGDDAT